MNQKQLMYFLATYHCRSIQTAADNLYITRQGLSRIIRSLEEELGQTLFMRSNKGLQPTGFATTLIPYAQKLVDDYECIAGINTLASQKKSVVTVYSLDHIFSYLGADFFRDFYNANPDITINIIDTTDEIAIDSLYNDKSDFAIVCGPIDNTKFTCEKLFFSRYCLRISKDNALSKKTSISVLDLDGQRIIGKGREYKCFRKNIDERLLAANISIDILIETSDESIIRELVEHNLAIAATYSFSALDNCGVNTVIRYLDEQDCGQNIYLVEKQNSLSTKARRIFKNFLLKWIHEHNKDVASDDYLL